MKKTICALTALAVMSFVTGAFAAMQPAAAPTEAYNGQDYVGKIVASSYSSEDVNGQQSILIMTAADSKNQSNLKGLTIRVTDKDLPYGLTLAGAVGKKIAVIFKGDNYDIGYVQLITDQYWNGDKVQA